MSLLLACVAGFAAGYALASLETIKAQLRRIESRPAAPTPERLAELLADIQRAGAPPPSFSQPFDVEEERPPPSPFWQPLSPDDDPKGLYERDATTGAVRLRGIHA